MCSTEQWRAPFSCVWVVLLVWRFHQIWPLLSVPQPRSCRLAWTPRPPKPCTLELCPVCRARAEPLSVGECLHVLTRRGCVPGTVGQGYSTLAWVPESRSSWALPLLHERGAG